MTASVQNIWPQGLPENISDHVNGHSLRLSLPLACSVSADPEWPIRSKGQENMYAISMGMKSYKVIKGAFREQHNCV